jgi:hypothetical protein
MSYSERYIDREAGRQALEFVAPLLERAATDPAIGQSGVMYVVIMNPVRTCAAFRFENAILIERGFGKPRAEWDADYAQYARKKAQASWRLGVASGDDRAAAYWSEAGHAAPLAGGMAVEDITVAVSGADPAYDEALAGAIALILRAILKLRERAASLRA